MIRASESAFSHPRLNHVVADTRALPFAERFDKAVSTNSIVPPSRNDVVAMYKSIYNALKKDGSLIAYLPSFDLCADMLEKHEFLRPLFEERMDPEQCRFLDTVGWQCFHTQALIFDELEKAGFRRENIGIQIVGCDSREEAEDLGNLYHLPSDLMMKEFSCYFVKARR